MDIIRNKNFKDWLERINDKISNSQVKAALKVNDEMLQLYFEIGSAILKIQKDEGWGTLVIDCLSSNIKKYFPNLTGFSVRNLKYMRSFALEYSDYPIVQVPLAQLENEFVQVSLAQITWYHHITLLTKVKSLQERAFYIVETANNEWSRDIMLLNG